MIDWIASQFGRAGRAVARITPVLQTTATDCGLACMAMVLQSHGSTINLEGLRKSVPASAQGVSVSQLLGTATSFGLHGRAVRAELDALQDLALPAILHWNFNHYVLLERVGADGAVIIDPSKGRQALSLQEVSNQFTGIAIEFKRLPGFATVTQLVGVALSDLWSRLEGWRRSTLLVGALSLLIQAAVLAAPLFLSVVVDQAIALRSIGLLEAMLLAMVAAQALVIVGELLRRQLLLSLGTSLIAQLNLNLVHHLLRLPYSFFLQSRLNDVLTRMEALRDVKEALTEGAVPFAIDGLFSLLIVGVIVFLSPLLAGALLLFYLAFGAIKLAAYRRLRALNELEQERQAAERSHIMDTLRGIQTVKVLNAEPARLSAWHGAHLALLDSVREKQSYEAHLKALNSALAALELVVLNGVAAWLVIQGAISVGLMFALVALRQQFRDRAYPLIERLLEFKLAHARLQRLAGIVTTAKEYEVDPAQVAPADMADLSIHLRQVRFQYAPHAPALFSDLNLSVGAGKFIAIKGRSGLGKSTLIKLMLGLVQPSGGTIHIGATPLQGAAVGAFRNIASAVLQDDQLFSGTLFDNISAFDPHADMARIEEAAELACVHADIMKMPAAYFAQVGDMGASLSGGQRQRILLARALYRRPQVLFLDEGTANLDLANEAEIIRRLRTLGITIICVAHRTKAMEVADEVYELVGGRLVAVVAEPDYA